MIPTKKLVAKNDHHSTPVALARELAQNAPDRLA